VLAGHPKLKNDLRRPSMEEIGSRATIFELEGSTNRSSTAIYQVRVVLCGVGPLMWRRLLVASETSLAELHETLQTAFKWSCEHLHGFLIHGAAYGIRSLGGIVPGRYRSSCSTETSPGGLAPNRTSARLWVSYADSASASRYFGDKETLYLYWPLGTVTITGPKVLDFYAGFCAHRATCLKADGSDVTDLNLISYSMLIPTLRMK
jgi:hypothetical protein